jgi:hypothetical protein
VLPTPTWRSTSRDGSPASYVSLKISRTLRIFIRSVGIGRSFKRSSQRRPDHTVKTTRI